MEFMRLCQYIEDRYTQADNDHKLKMLSILIHRDNTTERDKLKNVETANKL